MLSSTPLRLSPLQIPKFQNPSLVLRFQPKTPIHCLGFSSFQPIHHVSSLKISGYDGILLGPCCSSSSISIAAENDLGVELGRLLSLLPEEMRRRVSEHPELHQLIEVVMDLGRKPLARFPSGDFVLSDYPITMDNLENATCLVGDFANDNRAGISRTLHRISAIRNRKGAIIGLTCRVGRAISGSANLLRDLVKDGASLLLIGPPGVGKTTIIRDMARMLANDYKKRVMIVDTSNEIGGDGDIPHAGIGSARRMQVPSSDMQHKVMIEAVENHMPQVIVIDEIGTKLEAIAASTIAQRGIQLVATAHGVTIENLIMNPSLEMLVGGVQSVTLGDEEASRRGVQKTVLERKGPSTFSCGVEIISKSELRVHCSLEATVDAILAGRSPIYKIRKMNMGLKGDTVKPYTPVLVEDDSERIDEKPNHYEVISEMPPSMEKGSFPNEVSLRIFVYGILETSVIQGIKQLGLEDSIEITENISEADALLALQSKLKKNPRIQAAAKSHGIPIYVTKTSSVTRVTNVIQALLTDHTDGLKDFKSEDKVNVSEKIDALEEARIAIEQVVIPKGESVELLPRPPYIILLQKELIRKYKLQSERIGKGPDERLWILPYCARVDKDELTIEMLDDDKEFDDLLFSSNPESNGSAYSVERLPVLPN